MWIIPLIDCLNWSHLVDGLVIEVIPYVLINLALDQVELHGGLALLDLIWRTFLIERLRNWLRLIIIIVCGKVHLLILFSMKFFIWFLNDSLLDFGLLMIVSHWVFKHLLGFVWRWIIWNALTTLCWCESLIISKRFHSLITNQIGILIYTLLLHNTKLLIW